MTTLTETTICIVAIIAVGAPPVLWYVDRFLDATRSHIVEISKTSEDNDKNE